MEQHSIIEYKALKTAFSIRRTCLVETRSPSICSMLVSDAKMARKDKLVFNIAGDGCFRMNMNEIATATRYNIPVIEVVVNNHVLGMVRQWQDLFYGQRYSQTVLNDRVDFAKVAEGLGAKGYTVSTCEEFDNAVKEAIELNIPVVIDAQIDKDDKVFPMVAPGAPISECFGEEDVAEKFGR